METEKDIVADAVLAAEKAVIWARKEKALDKKNAVKEISAAKKKSQNAARTAVSQYIKELEKREGRISKIAERIVDFIAETQEKDASEKTKDNTTDTLAMQRSLRNWCSEEGKGKPTLLNLSLLTQVFDRTYDHILGLDKRTYICADWLTYGYTLDFFSYLFTNRKIDILPVGFDGICGSVTKAASKGSFDMTQHFIFNDKSLVDMFDTLNYLKQNKKEALYKEKLQNLVSKYKNEPLDPSVCKTNTFEDIPMPANAIQGNYTDEKQNFGTRLKAISKAYGKNEAEFCRDAFIGKSTFVNWFNGFNDPSIDKLFLIAITYGFSVDSILRTGVSDEFIKKQQNKYTYGNTLLFIDQLLNIGTIKRVLSSKYDPFANLREQPFGNSVSYMGISSGTDQNNAMFSPREEQNAFYPGIFKIQDDFLIRLIAEMGNNIILPLNAPQNPDIAQVVSDIAHSNMKELITKYNDEHLLYYHKDETGNSLTDYSKKWYLKNHCLNTSVDLDVMLKELRAEEIKAHRTLQAKKAIKQET